jgi:phage prohead protease, HK97 family
MERKEFEFNLKAAAADAPDSGLSENEFEGIGNAFGNLDSYGDVTLPGAFQGTLKRFQAEGVLLYQHRPSMVLGKPVDAKEVQEGLYLRGRISETTLGKDVLTLLRDGVLRKMSIGYNTVRAEWFDSVEAFRKWCKTQGLTDRIHWDTLKDWKYSIRALAECNLWEVSVVTFPANTLSDVTGVKDDTDAAEGVRLGALRRRIAILAETLPESARAARGQLENVLQMIDRSGRAEARPANMKDFEGFLCDAGGFSRREAKVIASEGFRTLLRDAESGDSGNSDNDVAEGLKSLLATLRA